MGIPIDPDDPVNGGCPVCIYEMPDFLWVVFDDRFGDHYTGTVETFEFGRWDGILKDQVGFERYCIVDFCAIYTGQFQIWVVPAATIILEDVHCNLPVAGSNDQGDSVVVSLVP